MCVSQYSRTRAFASVTEHYYKMNRAGARRLVRYSSAPPGRVAPKSGRSDVFLTASLRNTGHRVCASAAGCEVFLPADVDYNSDGGGRKYLASGFSERRL